MSILNRIEQLERQATSNDWAAKRLAEKQATPTDYARLCANLQEFMDEHLRGQTPQQQERIRQGWADYFPNRRSEQ